MKRIILAVACSLLVSSVGCASSARSGANEPGRDRAVISAQEIETHQASNAFELVQALRPAWLRARPTQSFTETARGGNVGNDVSYVPGADQIVVYLDKARLGGLDALRQIHPQSIQSIQMLDARQANYRFGTGHHHGVILLTSR
jgi:hypothetical protein